ncbi:hypothetical protein [Sphingobacterium suaedae]|uniref:Uncharacterized protein n=1 Tax=Sphingobacterium suaedae TaxID=1686402 RepID=A0ABW5KQN4_9SPHI
MKTVSIIVLSILSLFAIDLEKVRQQFEQAKDSKQATEDLYASLQSYTKNDPVILAYKGASMTLKARLLASREEKKKMVSEGIKLLEKAVKASPKNVEIRLVRLAIQEHAPKVLKYKMNIHEDKQMILANFAAQPTGVKTWINRYAKQSNVFSPAEQAKLVQ